MFFNVLDQVDSEVVRLSELKNVYSVICNGADSSNKDELISSLHYIEGSLADISEKLNDSFQQLHRLIINIDAEEDIDMNKELVVVEKEEYAEYLKFKKDKKKKKD